MLSHSELDEKQRQLRSVRIQIRYYISLLIFIAVATSLAALAAIIYTRRDNERTRNLICEIADQVQINTKECK